MYRKEKMHWHIMVVYCIRLRTWIYIRVSCICYNRFKVTES